jgi:hypothetical protein
VSPQSFAGETGDYFFAGAFLAAGFFAGAAFLAAAGFFAATAAFFAGAAFFAAGLLAAALAGAFFTGAFFGAAFFAFVVDFTGAMLSPIRECERLLIHDRGAIVAPYLAAECKKTLDLVDP